MEPKQLTLVKDDQRFVFRYIAGSEATVLDSLIDMASDDACTLDWFDAAVLSYQIGRTLGDAKKLGPTANPSSRHESRNLRGE